MSILQLLVVTVLVAGIAGTICYSKYLRTIRETNGRLHSLGDDLNRRLERLEGLEQRIQVLEKIVTDRRYDLMRRFSELEKTG